MATLVEIPGIQIFSKKTEMCMSYLSFWPILNKRLPKLYNLCTLFEIQTYYTIPQLESFMSGINGTLSAFQCRVYFCFSFVEFLTSMRIKAVKKKMLRNIISECPRVNMTLFNMAILRLIFLFHMAGQVSLTDNYLSYSLTFAKVCKCG